MQGELSFCLLLIPHAPLSSLYICLEGSYLFCSSRKAESELESIF